MLERLYQTVFAACLLLTAATAAAESVVYEYNGQPYEGFWSHPEGQPDAPLVLLVHDWDGLTDYEIKRTEMLVKAGYAVFAADLFGQGVRPETFPDRRRCTGELYENREKMRGLLNASLQAAGDQGAAVDNAVVMGYCFGGTAVLEMARSGTELKGFVTFHGGLTKPDDQDYANVKGSVLVLHGTADQGIPMSQFADLANDLEQAGVDHEMITYGGAPHAWTVFGSGRYREKADQDSWSRFLGFLVQTVN